MSSPSIKEFSSSVQDNGRRGMPKVGCDCVQCFGYCMVDLKELARRLGLFERKTESKAAPTLRYKVCDIVQFPAIGVDPELDRKVAREIETGRLRQVAAVTLPNGDEIRVGRTKGVPYVTPHKEAVVASLPRRLRRKLDRPARGLRPINAATA